MQKLALAAAVLLAAPAVLAEPPPPAAGPTTAVRVELRYAGGEMELDDDEQGDFRFKDSEGVDIRGFFQPAPRWFLRGEYVHSSSDEVRFEHENFALDSKSTLFRAGPGYQWSLGKAWIYASAEFLHVRAEAEGEGDSGDGGLITGGFKDDGVGGFIWNVELGLARVEHTDGGSFEFTLGWRATPQLSLLCGVQSMVFGDKHDDGQELSIVHETLGVGYTF